MSLAGPWVVFSPKEAVGRFQFPLVTLAPTNQQ
jgi:hypothetical protein